MTCDSSARESCRFGNGWIPRVLLLSPPSPLVTFTDTLTGLSHSSLSLPAGLGGVCSREDFADWLALDGFRLRIPLLVSPFLARHFLMMR